MSIPDEVTKLRTLPPPIVTDLTGDGKNEVLLLTSRETLSIVNPRLIRRSLFEFTELYATNEALLPSPCIGFASGNLPSVLCPENASYLLRHLDE